MHKPDLGIYSHPKEFLALESEPMLNPREMLWVLMMVTLMTIMVTSAW